MFHIDYLMGVNLHTSSTDIHPQCHTKKREDSFPLRDPSCGFVEGNYSHRKAIIGSTFAARRAGTKQASSATIVNNNATTMNVTGSVALTPNSKVFINRVRANAEVSPIATPAAPSFPPCAMTSFNTSLVCAPRAIRTPISCVRRATE